MSEGSPPKRPSAADPKGKLPKKSKTKVGAPKPRIPDLPYHIAWPCTYPSCDASYNHLEDLYSHCRIYTLRMVTLIAQSAGRKYPTNTHIYDTQFPLLKLVYCLLVIVVPFPHVCVYLRDSHSGSVSSYIYECTYFPPGLLAGLGLSIPPKEWSTTRPYCGGWRNL